MLFVASVPTLFGSRRGRRHECPELTLKRLRYAVSPSFRDRMRNRVGQDLLFTLFKTIEDAGCRCFARRLRNLEAAVHIGVDGADAAAIIRDSFGCQSGSQSPPQV